MAIYSSHSSNSLGQYWIQIGFNLIELLSSRYDRCIFAEDKV